MNYLVIELQTTGGVTSNIVSQFDNLPAAEQQFYLVCSAAVVSSVDTHAVILMADTGNFIRNECFTHVNPEPNT